MRLCSNCDSPIDENAKVCPMCGAALDNDQATQASENADDVLDTDENYDYKKDVEANKAIAVCSYLSILFVIPLFAAKESKFARFHALQGLVLFGLGLILWMMIAIINALFALIFPYFLIYSVSKILRLLVSCIILVFSILGIVNVINGKMMKLPIIGNLFNIK